MHSGGCLCGAVRFTTQGPLRAVTFCHCSQCRRQTGLYYATTSVPLAGLVLTGADHITWYAASTHARRGFCGTCGSALFWQPLGEDRMSILAGAFDAPAVLTPGKHICTQGRAQFYDISDGLPHHP